WGRAPRPGDTDERFCGAYKLRFGDNVIAHATAPMAQVLRTGEAVHDLEVEIERPDGVRRTVTMTIEPLRHAGRIQGAINCFHDVTERKRAEAAALRAQAARLNTLNRIAKTLASDLDLERIVQDVTDSATELSGAKFGAFFYNAVDKAG